MCVSLFAVTLAACAALPDDAPVVEQLDSDTGVTIARLGHPVELYRETFMADAAGRFAFLGPFETNQMGSRELFLWLAVPVEIAADDPPVLEIDGNVLELPIPSREASSAGLTKSPYKIPTPWSSMFYYKIDPTIAGKLAAAATITLRVLETTKSGSVSTVFTADVSADARLRDFGSR